MKNLFFLASLIILFSFTACQDEKPDTKWVEPQTEINYAAKKPKVDTLLFSPTTFGISSLTIEKWEEGGDCSGKGHVNAEFTFYLTAKVATDSIYEDKYIVGYDCGKGRMDGHRVSGLHAKLLKEKAANIQVFATISNQTLTIQQITVKDKWTGGKNGEAAQVSPGYLVFKAGDWQPGK